MRERPDHRYRAALAAIQGAATPSDPLSAELYRHLDNATGVSEKVMYAYEIYSDEEHRAVVDAFLLAQCSFKEIAETLEIGLEVIETYSALFLDVTVFRNRLERLSFAARYESSQYGKELVETAVKVGPEYLHWAYNKGSLAIDPRTIIARTMTDAYFRGMAHKGNALTTGVAKEANKWWQMAIKNAELSERLNPSTAKQAIDELRIALAQKDETHKPDQFDVPTSEILH